MKKANILNLLLLTTSGLSTRQDTVTDLFLFLLRYSFLLNDTSKPQNSCDQKTPQLNVPQGNIYMGARYLDPKYSRWISVDPALGEYIPAAGKGNSENAGNLPGMGGIYNSVNLSLFHYAGNNPVRYLDPDGNRQMTTYELKFATEILGNATPLNTEIKRNISDAGSLSTPNGTVYIQKSLYSDAMTSADQLSNLMHELFHQVQYSENPAYIALYANLSIGLSVNKSRNNLKISGYIDAVVEFSYSIGVLPKLAGEFLIDEYMSIINNKKRYVYQYGDLSQYTTLSDFPYLESQAEMVGDFSLYYYQERYCDGASVSNKKNMRKMAEILQKSGYDSEAIKWVLENY